LVADAKGSFAWKAVLLSEILCGHVAEGRGHRQGMASTRLKCAIGLDSAATDEAVAKRLAALAVAKRLAALAETDVPAGGKLRAWSALAEVIEHVLGSRAGPTLSSAEAGHDVVATLERRMSDEDWQTWVAIFKWQGHDSNDPESRNPDEALRSVLMFKLLPHLANAYGFRLT
jgi:hypothetical protein